MDPKTGMRLFVHGVRWSKVYVAVSATCTAIAYVTGTGSVTIGLMFTAMSLANLLVCMEGVDMIKRDHKIDESGNPIKGDPDGI